MYPIRHSWATRALQRSLDPLTEAILGPTRPRSGVSRGLESDATEEERTAALVVAVAEPDEAEVETPVAKRPRLPQLPQLRLKRIRAILTGHFACEWSMAKGSERKVYRQGGKQFTFSCHGLEPQVHPVQVEDFLGKLETHAQRLHSQHAGDQYLSSPSACHRAVAWRSGELR